MAWKDTLLDASFRGVSFEVMNVTRAGQRAVVVNEYPYQAGADLDDLNLRARRVKLKAVVYGDDYENQLDTLIRALESPGAGELIHPIHGSMTVLAESWDDEHDADLVDGAIVNISFIEHSVRELVFSASAASARTDAVVAKALDARAAADDALVRHVQSALGGAVPRIKVLKDLFSQAKARLTALLDTTVLRVVLSDLDPLLFPRAYVADLRAVVDRALQGLPFGGRNLLFDEASGAKVQAGSGVADFTTARALLEPAVLVLAPAVAAPDSAMLADTAAVQAHARVHGATAVAEAAAIVLAAELEQPLLDRAEVEAVTHQAREALALAIAGARAALDAEGRSTASQALRDVAYELQEAALAVINLRPSLVERLSPVGGPVRLVAHVFYADGARAQEIVRINRLGRKVFVDSGEPLRVYAA